MSKKDIVGLISYLVLLLVFGLAIGFVVKQTTIREQEQIRHEMELDYLEEIYYWIQEGAIVDAKLEQQENYNKFLENKVNYLYEKVLENKEHSQNYKQDLENFETYLELVVDYFDLENHAELDGFELWLFNNHKTTYEWMLNYGK